MKVLRLVFATLAIGVTSIPVAQARDSFSIGLNFGSPYYYAPPVQYYAPPPVVYYSQPTYYSQPSYYAAPPAYYYPQASFAYYGHGGRGHHSWKRGWDDDRGWGHGRRHGRHHDDDDD